MITCISVTKTFNLAGLQASTTVFPNLEMKKKFDGYWGGMDIHRNNAFSSVAMEAALNEGEEWLEQLLAYISGNLDYICDYFEKDSSDQSKYAGCNLSCVAGLQSTAYG